MNVTEFLGLNLPSPDDYYDVEQFNENMRKIDQLLGRLKPLLPKQLIATFLASGTFRPLDYGLNFGDTIDVYMVGGGSGGHSNSGRGGGGGFCRLLKNVVIDRENYPVIIGAGGAANQRGGATSVLTESVSGGGLQGFGGSGGGAGTLSNGGARGGEGGRGAQHLQISGGTQNTLLQAAGAGTAVFCPVNPYDNIHYGCGGGAGRQENGMPSPGGGLGPWTLQADANGWIVPQTATGGLGGGGGAGESNVRPGGRGGIGGGGGGNVSTSSGGGSGGQGLVYIYAHVPAQEETPIQSVSAANSMVKQNYIPVEKLNAEVMETHLEPMVKEKKIQVAVMKNDVCKDVVMFENLKTAKTFLKEGFFPDADNVVTLPEGYGIGDVLDGKQWQKKEEMERTEAKEASGEIL